MNIIICGFYRSGVQLLTGAIATGNGKINHSLLQNHKQEWNERLEFLGINPKNKDSTFIESAMLNKEEEFHFLPCFIHPKHWKNHLQNSAIIVVYRPIEQVIDSVTRHGIKEIYLTNKGFGRMKAMRRFNKNLALIQQQTKAAYIDFYGDLMNLLDEKKHKSIVINSHRFQEEYPSFLDELKNLHELEIEPTKQYYNEDMFTQQKAIDKYRDESLNRIHRFFTEKDR